MSKHISRARNPKIAHVFFLAGFIEAWGRGYEKIMREFDKANLKHPIFREEHGGVTAIIPREIFLSIRGGVINGAKNDAKNGAKNGANVGAKLTERQKDIISLIKSNHSISLDDIAKELSRLIEKLRNLVMLSSEWDPVTADIGR